MGGPQGAKRGVGWWVMGGEAYPAAPGEQEGTGGAGSGPAGSAPCCVKLGKLRHAWEIKAGSTVPPVPGGGAQAAPLRQHAALGLGIRF